MTTAATPLAASAPQAMDHPGPPWRATARRIAGASAAGAAARPLLRAEPGNSLLTALLSARLDKLASGIERIDLRAGALLHLPGDALSHVYFPLTAIISSQHLLGDGCEAEVSSIGNEGVAGLGACLAADGACARQLVVSAGGQACRVPLSTVRRALQRPGPALGAMLRYAQSELIQTGQLSACNCHHGTMQRACRWLLYLHARRPAGVIDITHDALAGMLGVRRESVTEVIRRLREMDVLRSGRGWLAVDDAAALQRNACECYALLRDELARLRADLQRYASAPAYRYRAALLAPASRSGRTSLSPAHFLFPR